MEKWKPFLSKAILSGIFINIAATIYLSTPDKVVGSVLFTFGLFAVLVTQSNLYTGMAGYFPIKPIKDIAVALIGNIAGCVLYSVCYSFVASSQKLRPIAASLCDSKFEAPLGSVFFASVFCGMLMFIAVDTYNKNKNIIGIIVVVLCVSGFILAGFEHSIANISYICLAQYALSIEICIRILIMIIGNFIGAVLVRKLVG